ncbi:TonB family protein [Hellea balneolensis]|uniref:TonB family protein n=1 Tax=Hellea balneolensis TaxID=287478 RepID=UPI00047C72C7|nr:TonB family protein [Hellea balneolensis]
MMGLQGIATTNGASVIFIEQTCDNDQLLVSLSKNGTEWLSPVGWTDQQKVTLLDCRPNGKTTEIDIPAEFAATISSGDVLVLRCSELDFEKEIIWEASEIETRLASETAKVSASSKGGLLSRFKSPKIDIAEETRTEAEVRAEEAERAAQNFKAKMEAATAAKEDAQRKALEAAREAEAALKMEADRIAEMERAAKAFEEAERLKQDELRRVEEERRAEEARLAEEARRIEEARKREIAAKKEAERKAALERYEAALDITRNEELRLKDRLKDLEKQAASGAENLAVQTEDLDVRRANADVIEGKLVKRFDSYEKSATKLDKLTADLSALQAESEVLSDNRKTVSERLSVADRAYHEAQKEAEAAMAFAQKCREELDEVRQEEEALSGKLSAMSEGLSKNSHLVAEASEKSYKLKSNYDLSQTELDQAKIEIEALEQALVVQAEKDHALRLEIEATQQAVEDSQAREAAHRSAIDHLEAGGMPDDIAELDLKAKPFATSKMPNITDTDVSHKAIVSSGRKSKRFGRGRRSRFSREKDAEISVDVEEVVLSKVEEKSDAVLLAGIDESPSFIRRHGSSFMALGAIIGGIAILGGGLALTKSSPAKLQVKSSASTPTKVASAVTQVEKPVTKELPAVEIAQDTPATKPEAAPIETPPKVGVEASSNKPVLEEISAEAAIPEISAETDLSVEKLASVVDPVGFAFELPDMRPQETVKAKVETPASKVVPKKLAVKTNSTENLTPTKTATRKAVKLAPPRAASVNYPELTADVQMRLSDLGFYSGPFDGLQNGQTQEAIKEFKSLFGMADTSSKITGSLLTELKKVKREQDIAQKEAEAQAQALLNVQSVTRVAEMVPALEFYDTQTAVPAQPIITDTLPASEPLPSYIVTEPSPVKVASVPAVKVAAPTPVMKDVIIEAKMTRNASAVYPSKASRRDYYANVAIVVGYDVGTDGRVTNVNILSNDHSGLHNEAFEKEALRAIEKMRYEPKTVNGEAVISRARQKRIVFRGE